MPSALPDPSAADLNETPAGTASLSIPARLRQRLSKRLAALSAVGALMVALPLFQVLRYQNAEIHSLMAERAGLDPMARAVEAQRGLLTHRDLAAQVLRGRSEKEAERKVRQGEVDDRVTELAVTLARGAWERAVRESDALREDWMLLARQVGDHSIASGESDLAHRLLVEQTLQVMDLVADASAPGHAEDAEGLQTTLSAARALPRLAWRLALLSRPVTPNASEVEQAARQRELATAEAGVARTLGSLNATLARHPRPELVDASAGAGAAADRYFHLLRAGLPRDAEIQAEIDSRAAAAVRTHLALFDQAHQQAAAALSARLQGAQGARYALVAAMVALGAIALLLLGSLLRALGVPPPVPQAPEPAATGPRANSHDAAEDLLQRLRQREDSATASTRPAGLYGEQQPTLPGRL